jgi:hypothetical protein
MKSIRAVLLLVVFGFCLSATLGALSLHLLPPGVASATYLWPGTYVAPMLGKIIPTSAVYWLVPEGGAPAYLLLIGVGAFVSWAVLLGLVAFVVGRWVRPNNSFKPTSLCDAA